MSVTYQPVGTVRSPWRQLTGMPLQTVAAQGVAGVVEVAERFAGGLSDVEGFSHLILITHLHASIGWTPQVVPFLDDQPRGVFACRSPRRPNPIGLSLVRLVRVEGRRLHVLDVDLLDGTPVLDIKPYVPRFDARETARIGWFASRLDRLGELRSDGASPSLRGTPAERPEPRPHRLWSLRPSSVAAILPSATSCATSLSERLLLRA